MASGWPGRISTRPSSWASCTACPPDRSRVSRTVAAEQVVRHLRRRPSAAPHARRAIAARTRGRRSGRGSSFEDVPHADVERVGPVFVLREDPRQPVALVVLEQDDLVARPPTSGCASRSR
ncbi:MAG: hypothetical protein MZV64_13505 [Ignavibacteriales bacterium]|nr:hypothetical protein [Ignavibacteriales bacterium]